jgi:zeaxanthin glucosyltransferase
MQRHRPTLVVVAAPVWGHLCPILELGRRLEAGGYRVHHLAMSGFRRLVSPELCSDVTDLASEDASKDASHVRAARDHAPSPPPVGPFWTRVAGWMNPVSKLMPVLSALRAGALDSTLARLQPCAMLVDSLLPEFALAAHRLGIPVATLYTDLALPREPDLPPTNTAIVPAATLPARLRSRIAWTSLGARRQFVQAAATWIGVDYYREFSRFAATCGYDPRHLSFTSEDMRPRLRTTPEFVLCGESFDFPSAGVHPHRHYLGPCVRLDGEEGDQPFPWGWLQDDRSLVYCSLGTLFEEKLRLDQATRFFNGIVHALAQRPGLQGVVRIGSRIRPEQVPGASNVQVVAQAPQLSLLRRAKLMIGHGGLGSIKECILSAVPMLVFPIAYDQPGNAARIAYHRLGLVGDIHRAPANAIGAAIDEILEAPHRARGLPALSRAFQDDNGMDSLRPLLDWLDEPVGRQVGRLDDLRSSQPVVRN